MGRSLGPILRTELENLDKDANSRKEAMKALKSYVKDLDSKAIPVFLAQVSETKQAGVSFGEHTVSLYEVLARVHGPKITPQIDNIMSSIVKTLSSSAGAFALHQACSKVVPAIARYTVDPVIDKDEKRRIIHTICKPLSDCLLGSRENLSSGAALCLQALVESDNWRFASNEMVNEVCQRVAGALEKYSLTNSHMALVTALAKHNSLTVEAYARLLIQSGLKILHFGYAEANSQKQFTAIHMVSSIMKCLDPKSIMSEMELVIKEMEKCQFDRMQFVTGAAFEALQMAKRISSEKGSKEFDRRRKNTSPSGNRSPLTASPESQTVDSFVRFDYFDEPPTSMNCRSVNRKLWQRSESGGVDVSLKDGIFTESEITRGSDIVGSEYDEFSENHGDNFQQFVGFVQGNGNGVVRSNTPSPQQSKSRINVEDVRIFTTPRKLLRSLQDLDNSNSGSMKQARRFRSPMQSNFPLTPTSQNECNGLSRNTNNDKCTDSNFSSGSEKLNGSSESVFSTKDEIANNDLRVSFDDIPNKSRLSSINGRNTFCYIVCGTFVVLFAILACLMAIDEQDAHGNLVPT